MTSAEITAAITAMATLLTTGLLAFFPDAKERAERARLKSEAEARIRKSRAILWQELARQQALAAKLEREKTDGKALPIPPTDIPPAA